MDKIGGKHTQAKLTLGWYKRCFSRKENAIPLPSGAYIRKTQDSSEIFIFKNIKAEFYVVVVVVVLLMIKNCLLCGVL